MLGCKCYFWGSVTNPAQPGREYFSLPDPIPQWPEGTGFSTSRINLGELEVCQITKFEFIWGCNLSTDSKQGVSFYKPTSIPHGFSCLGHYCQSNEKPLRGFVLVARQTTAHQEQSPPLSNPVDYSLLWISKDDDDDGKNFLNCVFFWFPQPPEGYESLGFVVTHKSEKPNLEEVKCVRTDLTDACETHSSIVETYSKFSKVPLKVFKTRPVNRGMYGRGVCVGTFQCCSGEEKKKNIACLKNLDSNLHAMPNLDQIHAIIKHYGPTLYFHPEEIYLASSVSWFFKNGALLYSKTDPVGQPIDADGSCLPVGGCNDGVYWIDLPAEDERARFLKRGNLESAVLYVHAKPALGGSFTDIAMWVFSPFNGPGTLKVGMVNVGLTKVGRHVGDWEHVTLRISNFSGEIWSVYFSQHSAGEWVESCDLEFVEGNRFAVYSSRNGHASFPRPGCHVQGAPRIGIGVRNDVGWSVNRVDSSKRYEVVAAEYLGVVGPRWLGYMRGWGPTVVYDTRGEMERVVRVLPAVVRWRLESVLDMLPLELYREEGPTGPKGKSNWVEDEKC